MKLFLFIVFFLVVSVSGCLEETRYDGGKNENEEKPGNQDGGNSVRDLSLSSDGRFLIRGTLIDENDPYSEKVVKVLDFETGRTARLDFEGREPLRILFGRSGFAYFIVKESEIYFLQEFDLLSCKKNREWMVNDSYKFAIDRTETLIALWGENDITTIDTINDKVYNRFIEGTVFDLKWLPLSNEIAVVQSNDTGGSKIKLMTLQLEDIKEIEVPNCASSLEISSDGGTGMISPTYCKLDPVSVIDLKKRSFVKNLPGFGPVAFAPDGKYAVAFARKRDLENAAGIKTETLFSMLFIDLEDYSYEVLELGSRIPVYTITPDSELILLYSESEESDYKGIVVINYEKKEIRSAFGKQVAMNEFVMTPDSRNVFLIDENVLYKMDTKNLVISELKLKCGLIYGAPSYCSANEIMITPDGSEIILGMVNGIDFAIFDPVYLGIKRIISME